jgi:DNA-binding beta-propeller fold protein YncE
MKTTRLLVFACLMMPTLLRAELASLTYTSSIKLPDVKGRTDHFGIDIKGRRLFVAALENDTVEILNLPEGQVAATIKGCSKPQGILHLPSSNRLCVANGGDGTVRFYNAETCALLKPLEGMDDADNVRLDDKSQTIYVGYGDGALAVIKADSMTKVADIKLAGHPESFQLEKSGPRIFVNVPDARHIAVIDREKLAVVATWPLGESKANFPMALDESHQRLFVGCRRPAQLLVLDTHQGAKVANVPISGDTDDLFYDAARRQIYISCGEGFVNVIEQKNADTYALREKLSTVPGARTSYFSPATNEFYLAQRAVPLGGAAEVRVYKAN